LAERPTVAAGAREEADRIIREESPRILGVLQALHDDPELSGEERRASLRLGQELASEGFEIEPGAGGLPTAFVARRGAAGAGHTRRAGGSAGRPATRAAARVAFLAEYDALPELGHGCGHNLVAAAALGAGIAVGRLVEQLGGEVRVCGTPAEETVGGKVVLAEQGLFDDLDAAMMVHPGNEHRVFTTSLASQSVQVEFHGRSAHAAAHPDKGINALDAMIQLFVAVSHIRGSSGRDVRIPGVILHGGERPNVVPDRAVARFSVRAATSEERDGVLERVHGMGGAIAQATGCRLAFELTDRPTPDFLTNRALAEAYRGHLASEGIATNDMPRDHMGSLDMGTLSRRVPSLHAYVAIAPPDVVLHTRAFAEATISERGRQAALLAARMLARTAVDLMCDPELLRRVRGEFEHARSPVGEP